MKFFKPALALLLGGLLLGAGTTASAQANLDDLLRAAKDYRQKTASENAAREREFVSARNEQRSLLQKVQSDLNAENGRSASLKQRFDDNEVALAELEETKRIRVGDMGELFGVVRQVAGDTNGLVKSSLITAQYNARAGDLLSKLADATDLPSIEELDRLRILLLEEMVESGKVVSFDSPIVDSEGAPTSANVVRVGAFNLTTGDKFLDYDPDNQTIKELPRQPEPRFQSLAGGLASATGGTVPMAVDPSFGGLMRLLIQAPSPMERIAQGGFVGYVILGIGAIGLLIALMRLMALFTAGAKIRSQLKSDTPNTGNALGRILSVYHENRDVDTDTLELKMDEAILKETPRLESGQNTLKVLAAVAPLLGLLGTVTGMIETFQQITLFGTGDPKLMAGGISQALVTTMLGLFVAIPLVLLHSFVAGRSKSLIEVLEEQSAGIVASQSERLQ